MVNLNWALSEDGYTNYKENIEKEINDILYYNFLGLSEFWNKNYYKLGFFDGLNAKKELEELNNG